MDFKINSYFQHLLKKLQANYDLNNVLFMKFIDIILSNYLILFHYWLKYF